MPAGAHQQSRAHDSRWIVSPRHPGAKPSLSLCRRRVGYLHCNPCASAQNDRNSLIRNASQTFRCRINIVEMGNTEPGRAVLQRPTATLLREPLQDFIEAGVQLLRAGDNFARRRAGDRLGVEVDEVAELRHQLWNAAGMMKVLHVVLAGRL